MDERLDNILEKLIGLAETQVDLAVKNQIFNKDLAESVCIVLSMAYGRAGGGTIGNQ